MSMPARAETAPAAGSNLLKMIGSELRYHLPAIGLVYLALAAIYGLVTTDRFGYTVIIGSMVAINAWILWARVKEMRERVFFTLPTHEMNAYVERVATPVIIAIGAALICGPLMLRETYSDYHPTLLLRMISMVAVVWLYNIGTAMMADAKFETQRGAGRWLLPGFVMALWIIIYTAFISATFLKRLSYGYVELRPLAEFLFDTGPGVAVMIVICILLMAVDYQLFRQRGVFGQMDPKARWWQVK